jgi:hypothetical protein
VLITCCEIKIYIARENDSENENIL